MKWSWFYFQTSSDIVENIPQTPLESSNSLRYIHVIYTVHFDSINSIVTNKRISFSH